MSIIWKKAKVKQIKDLTYNTRSFLLEAEAGDMNDFQAGQFVTFDLPISDRKSKRLRSYSISSCPQQEERLFELVIVLAIDGEGGSAYFFNEIKTGSTLVYRGPQGNFVLPSKIERDIYFICTGTGVAPFRSMLHSIFRTQPLIRHHLYLIFGTRKVEDLIYVEEMFELQRKHSNFTYLPTLSREKNAMCANGYVHAVYEKNCKDLPEVDFYLCGWRDMVDEAKQRILAMGYEKQRIFFELYG